MAPMFTTLLLLLTMIGINWLVKRFTTPATYQLIVALFYASAVLVLWMVAIPLEVGFGYYLLIATFSAAAIKSIFKMRKATVSLQEQA
jgi:hypothetical protein